MAHEEEMELEDILRETEVPARTNGKEKPRIKIAKLTGRTISSLKTKIREKKLSRSYKKYNNNYKSMRIALIDANRLKTAHERGEDVTASEVVEAFDIVASYDKKLAKYAVKLLKEDIKKVVESEKPRPIRVPRVLLGKLRPITKAIVNAVEKRKTKKLQKGLAKDIKAATKDYIRDSVEGALFKNDETGELRQQVDAQVIQGLATDRKAETFDDKIASLKRFISADGVTPVFGEEKIGSKETVNTDIPPVEPVASVEKEEKNVTEEQLLGGLGRNVPTDSEVVEKQGPKVEETELKGEKTQDGVTVESLMKGLETPVVVEEKEQEVKPAEVVPEVKEEPKVEENSAVVGLSDKDKEIISKRKREISTIVSLGKTIETLERQAAKTNNPETKEAIENYIEALNNDLQSIVNRSIGKEEITDYYEMGGAPLKENKEEIVTEPIKMEIEENVEQPVKSETIEPIVIEPKTEEIPIEKEVLPVEVQPIEPVVVEPQEEEFKVVRWADGDVTKEPVKKSSIENVEFKDAEPMRVEQISNPTALAATPQDIKKLEERNTKAQLQIADLTQRRQDLETQRAMLKQYIEVAETTRAAELQAQEMAKSNAALAGEVAELSSQVAAINSDLGRSK